MSLEWFTASEPEILQLEERCPICREPMLQKGTATYCRTPSHPTRVQTGRPLGAVVNEAADMAGRVASPAYSDVWSELSAT